MTVKFREGGGENTKIDSLNSNHQRNRGTLGVKGNHANQLAYKVECEECGFVYGANGADLHERRCPECKGGQPGIRYWLAATDLSNSR